MFKQVLGRALYFVLGALVTLAVVFQSMAQ